MMGKQMERRVFPVEMRVKRGEDGKPQIRGHAAVFNRLSEDLGGFKEKIDPGAFARAIKERQDVRSLFNHNPDKILGRTKSGTLKLEEDDDGLNSVTDPADTTYARDLLVSIERGDVDQMSFSFSVPEGGDSWEETEDGDVRTLRDVNLYDISPVTFPAYPDTDVAVRSHKAWRNDDEPQEKAEKPDESEHPLEPPIGARLLHEKVMAAKPK
jgi:HK97 family phage prohead protease